MASKVIPWADDEDSKPSMWAPVAYYYDGYVPPDPEPDDGLVAVISWAAVEHPEGVLLTDFKIESHKEEVTGEVNFGRSGITFSYELGIRPYMRLYMACEKMPLVAKFKDVLTSDPKSPLYTRGLGPALETWEYPICGHNMLHVTLLDMFADNWQDFVVDGRVTFELYGDPEYEVKNLTEGAPSTIPVFKFTGRYTPESGQSSVEYSNQPAININDGTVILCNEGLDYTGINSRVSLSDYNAGSYSLYSFDAMLTRYNDMASFSYYNSIEISGHQRSLDYPAIAMSSNLFYEYDFSNTGPSEAVQAIIDEAESGTITIKVDEIDVIYPTVGVNVTSRTIEPPYDGTYTRQTISGYDSCWNQLVSNEYNTSAMETYFRIVSEQRDRGKLVKIPYGPESLDLGNAVQTYNSSRDDQGYLEINYVFNEYPANFPNNLFPYMYPDGYEDTLPDVEPLTFDEHPVVPGGKINIQFEDIYIPQHTEAKAANFIAYLSAGRSYESDLNFNRVREVNRCVGETECEMYSFRHLEVYYDARVALVSRGEYLRLYANGDLSSTQIANTSTGIRVDGVFYPKGTDIIIQRNSLAYMSNLYVHIPMSSQYTSLFLDKILNDGGFEFEFVFD